MADSCDEDIKFIGENSELGTPQQNPCCGTETVLHIPDELREPEGVGAQGEPIPKPGPIIIRSEAVTVQCTDGAEGSSVTVPFGHFEGVLYLSLVLSLTDNVLEYIAKKKLESQIADILNQASPSAIALRDLTGMRIREANVLIEEAKKLKESLKASALAYADTQLTCLWYSTPQTATCDDPAMAQTGQNGNAVFSVTIPARKYTSQYSQEDADSKAMLEAQSQLNCFYLNDPVTARCEERPNRPSGADEPVPNDATEVYPGKGKRVGVVQVPAGKFKSSFSKEAANSMALEWGFSQLVCWYPSDRLYAECNDPNARDPGVIPEKEPAHDADLETGRKGQRVTIPEGYYTSDVSSEVATQQAEELIDTMLQCCFVNKKLVLNCIAEEAYLLSGERIDIPPAPYPISPNPQVVVEAGSFTSCVSQEEADEFAEISTEGLLQCMYCNVAVMPTCVPSWVIEGVQAPEDDPLHIDLPLRSGQIHNAAHGELSLATIPLNATKGIADCAVQLANASEAQQVANLLAALPIEQGGSGEVCTYYNDKVIVGCAVSDPYTGKSMEYGSEGYWGTVPQTGEAYYFYSMYPSGTCLYSALTTPAVGTYITIAAGMFSGNGEGSKEGLNLRAVEYAMSLLQCVFASPRTQVTCFYGSDYRKCFLGITGFCGPENSGCKACRFYIKEKDRPPDARRQFCSQSACSSAASSQGLCSSTWFFGRDEVLDSEESPEVDTNGDGHGDTVLYYDNSKKYLMDWSNTDARPVIIPKGTLLVINGGSENDIEKILYEPLMTLAQFQLRCDYGNAKISCGSCFNPFDPSEIDPGGGTGFCTSEHFSREIWNVFDIPEKTLIADSVNEATRLASALGAGANFCYTDYWVEYSICSYPSWHAHEFIPSSSSSSSSWSSSSWFSPSMPSSTSSSSSSSSFSSEHMKKHPSCYDHCPIYIQVYGKTWIKSPQFTRQTADKTLKEFQIWETDVAYEYEQMHTELRVLTKKLQTLLEEANEGLPG